MLTDSFLDYLRYERNYSEKTVLAYGEDISQLREFAQERMEKFDPAEVKPELVREWIVSLMDQGYTSTSVNRKLSSPGHFINIFEDRDMLTAKHFVKIQVRKIKSHFPLS